MRQPKNSPRSWLTARTCPSDPPVPPQAQGWSHPLPAANGLLLTLNAWKDAGEAYWSATVEDGGDTTALTMLEAFETEREAKRWSIGAARELLMRAIQDLEAL